MHMKAQQERSMDRRRFVQFTGIAGLGVAGAAFARAATAQSDPSTPTASPAASPGATPAASPGASPEATGQITMEMKEFSFNPNKITIPADTDVTIELTNTGVLAHDFVVEKLNVSSGLVNPGEKKSVTFKAAAGSYEFICSVEGHADAGMYGTLTVE
jgi:uncharacterized cupredoxin-like copper-binding protein